MSAGDTLPTPTGQPSEVVLRVGDTASGDVDAFDLSEFMMLLRGAYAAAQQLGDSPTVEALRSHIELLTAKQTTALFARDASPAPLMARRVSHQSPLEIAVVGVFVYLAVVAGLVGGTVRVGLFRIELSAGLADVVARLRGLFSKGAQTAIGYGARERRVKLTKEEFAELMRQDPATRSRGGFQGFLIALQERTNEQTRELTLYPSEIDRILRHGSQPKKGGFQSRIRKIFGTHFDWRC